MENALFEFFYSTGCRIGEVVKLNRNDINFITNSVFVHRKGDKEREVYFNTRCSLWLKRLKQTGAFLQEGEVFFLLNYRRNIKVIG
jgi:site-specific recombinase XerD